MTENKVLKEEDLKKHNEELGFLSPHLPSNWKIYAIYEGEEFDTKNELKNVTDLSYRCINAGVNLTLEVLFSLDNNFWFLNPPDYLSIEILDEEYLSIEVLDVDISGAISMKEQDTLLKESIFVAGKFLELK